MSGGITQGRQDRGAVESTAIHPGWAGAADLPLLSPQGSLGGGDGDEDAKNKRWVESVGMDIKKGRGEKTTTLYKRGHLRLQEDGVHVHRKGKKRDKKVKK
jgi:hypothetical protein